ncbi:MAG: low-complexity protein [Gammaproteobacteria bacterium]|nr:low-complexity protein [Gammaproteobacteria bacterium]
MKTSKTAITLVLTAALGTTGTALASENPFGMQVLEHGYQVAEADTHMSGTKMSDGKCGAKKVEEGKCAAKEAATTKAKDGQCGAGKDMPVEDARRWMTLSP